MSLQKYHSKRNFDKTKEPKGHVKSSGRELKFVVQKHAASRLHYDFRLEIDVVLVSWAVPKGPSPDPDVKRLAIQTENHPMDYLDFEGNIPDGEYGAGTVIVWDTGTFHVEGNQDAGKDLKMIRNQLQSGNIKVVLKGKKMKGAWHLVLMNNDADAKQWLLMKSKDKYAGSEIIFDELSVKSGKSMDEIKQSGADSKSTLNPNQKNNIKPQDLEDARKMDTFPTDWRPMLATLSDNAFDHEDWIFEIKYDGYRTLAEIKDKKVQLISRNGLVFSQFAVIQHELENLVSDNLILDGEIVMEDSAGKSHFQWLQNIQEEHREGILKYYVFDILYFNGFDLRMIGLKQRKKILKALLPKSKQIIFSDFHEEKGLLALRNAKKAHAEGLIAKKITGKYYPAKRSKDWLKIKIVNQQELVIGGYTAPSGSRKGLGALLCGYYKKNKLQYAGKVGTGFSEEILTELSQKLQKLARKTSPFEIPPNEKSVHWVTPKLVAQVKFSEWTQSRIMRHPVFLGLRTDKPASDVILESTSLSQADQANHTGKKDMKPSGKKGNTQKIPADSEEISEYSQKVNFTNLNKVFWPKEKVTKAHVIAYYNQVSELILPHLKDRPQSLRRTPDGLKSDGFFQKNVAGLVPEWISTKKIKSDSKDESIEYMLCQDKDTLLFMANWGCIELNSWMSRVGSINHPDFIVFDLDPKNAPVQNIITTALTLKKVLDHLQLNAYLKTSGGNGLHIFIPIVPKYSYDRVRHIAEIICQMVHSELPDITSLERLPSKRKGKVYLDFLQNGRGKTMASIYSLRPRPNLGVSTPLAWDELNDSFHMDDFNLFTISSRLEQKGDLWKDILSYPVDLKSILSNL